MTYTCKVCNVTSDVAEFYKSITSRCKECHKAKVRENRAENVEYYRSYDAKRFKEDPKVKARHKRYQATEAGKESIKKTRRAWLNKNPVARAAHIILGNAVKRGDMVKPKFCSRCGKHDKSRNIHAHHHDYSRPLDVEWICAKCHYDEHHT